MAQIIQRVISGSNDKGVTLGAYTTSSIDGFISRKMAWGSNWNVIRIGISLAINEFASQSWNRTVGMGIGVSSGSRNYCKDFTSRTFYGFTFGKLGDALGFNRDTIVYNNDLNSGSFFSISTHYWGSYATGTIGAAGGNAVGVWGIIPNNGSGFSFRKNLLIIEISASSTGYIGTTCAFSSASAVAQNTNRSFTSDELISFMTASAAYNSRAPSGSRCVMDRFVDGGRAYAKTLMPLDTTYDEVAGGTPIEIYDWYIYKVN